MPSIGLGTVAFVLVVLVAGCTPSPGAKPEGSEDGPAAAVAGPAVPAAPDRDELKRAARGVLSSWCGCDKSEPGYKEDAELVAGAGAAIVPVLAELVAAGDTSSTFVVNAARVATAYPLSEPLRAALRVRRDDPPLQSLNHWMVLELFPYFVQFGDASDLAWMEEAVGRMPDFRRQQGEKFVKELRERLQRNLEGA